jgi:hypothetical protein
MPTQDQKGVRSECCGGLDGGASVCLRASLRQLSAGDGRQKGRFAAVDVKAEMTRDIRANKPPSVYPNKHTRVDAVWLTPWSLSKQCGDLVLTVKRPYRVSVTLVGGREPRVTSVIGCSLKLSSDTIIQLVEIVAPDGRVMTVRTPWEMVTAVRQRGFWRTESPPGHSQIIQPSNSYPLGPQRDKTEENTRWCPLSHHLPCGHCSERDRFFFILF